MLFKPLQYADVGEAERPATFEDYADLRAVDTGGRLLAQASEGRDKQTKKTHYIDGSLSAC
jgi:hypothetical protein